MTSTFLLFYGDYSCIQLFHARFFMMDIHSALRAKMMQCTYVMVPMQWCKCIMSCFLMRIAWCIMMHMTWCIWKCLWYDMVPVSWCIMVPWAWCIAHGAYVVMHYSGCIWDDGPGMTCINECSWWCIAKCLCNASDILQCRWNGALHMLYVSKF